MKEKITKIEKIGLREVADITTDGDHLFYANGILTHNSGMEEMDFAISGIAGGISKAYSCDNMIAVYASLPMRERGEMQFQFLKTRNSAGNGRKLLMKYDIDTLKISDMPEDEQSTEYRPSSKVLDAVRRKNQIQDKPVFDNTDVGESLADANISKPRKPESLAERGANLTNILASIKNGI